MKFKKIENYLVYIQDKKTCKTVAEESSYCVYRKINTSNNIDLLENITNISFVSKARVISSLNQNDENINIIDVYIGMRIEFEYDDCISSEFIDIEKGDLFKSDECFNNININIDTIAIGLDDENRLTISIIYSLYI